MLPLNPLAAPQLTFGAWVFPYASFSEHDGARAVLTLDDAAGHSARALEIHAGRWVVATGSDGEGTLVGPAVRPGEWIFVAVVYDQADRSVALHVDGEFVTSPAFMGTGRRSLRIGARGTGAGTGLHGVLDNVFVYGAPLSATDLLILRAGTPPPPPPAAGGAGYALRLGGRDGATAEQLRRQWIEVPARSAASDALRAVRTADGDAALAPFGVSLWARPSEAVNGEAALVEWPRAWRLSLVDGAADGGFARVRVRLGWSESAARSLVDWIVTLPANGLAIERWSHLALGFNGTIVQLSLDGVLIASTPWLPDADAERTHIVAENDLPGAGDTLLVGAALDDAGEEQLHFFDGAIDELQIWGADAADSTSGAAVVDSQHAVAPPCAAAPLADATALLGYWRFDEGRGSVVADCSTRRAFGDGVVRAPLAATAAVSWTTSGVPLGACAFTNEDTLVLVRLNATDAQGRELRARITAPPALGTLRPASWRLSASGTHELALDAPLTRGDDVAIGALLAYTPTAERHSASAVAVFDTITYAARSLDGSGESAADADATLHIFVAPVHDAPRVSLGRSLGGHSGLGSASVATVTLRDYRVEDVDSWEDTELGAADADASATSRTAGAGNGVLQVSLSVQNATLTVGAVEMDGGGSVGGAAASSSREQLSFTEGDGIADSVTSFSAPLDGTNAAIEEITLALAAPYGAAQLSLSSTDAGGAVASAAVSLELYGGAVPVILSLAPPSSPPAGGGTLHVSGEGFHDHHDDDSDGAGWRCVFGRALEAPLETAATTKLGGWLECPIPPHSAGTVSLHIVSPVGYTSNIVSFDYRAPPEPLELDPSSGPLSGGTLVKVLISQANTAAAADAAATASDGSSSASLAASPLTRWACLFGEADDVTLVDALSVHTVAATVAAIVCVAPATAADGDVPVRVTSDGVHFSKVPLSFAYHAPPTVTWAWPTLGSAGGGARMVELHGAGFHNVSTLTCGVGSRVVHATFVSSAQVLCAVPARSELTTSTPGLSVSNNGVDFGPSSASFEYVEPVMLVGAVPPRAPVAGGTMITVMGENLIDSGALFCRFGALAPVPAVFLDGASVQCRVPAVEGVALGALVSMPLALSVNGVDYTEQPAPFSVYRLPTPLALQPRAGAADQLTSVLVTFAEEDEAEDGEALGRGLGELCSELYCWLSDSEPLPATCVGDRAVRCLLPAASDGAPGAPTLALTANLVDRTGGDSDGLGAPLTFVRFEPLAFGALSPDHGPLSGGTSVTVSIGDGGAVSDALALGLRCRFGDSVVPATVLDGGAAIRCTSPPLALARASAGDTSVAIQLIVDGDGLGGSPLMDASPAAFRYDTVLSVSSLAPQGGDVAGGTPVVVRGGSFSALDALRCAFGGDDAAVVEAQFLSRTSVQCISPASPMGATGPVAVRVSSNGGVDFSEDGGVSFSFWSTPVLTGAISPARGPSTGGTLLRVSGRDLPRSEALACAFDGTGIQTAAVWRSASLVECVAPAAAQSNGSDGAVSAAVAVTLVTNGFDVAAGSASFEFVRTVALTALSPAHGPTSGGTVCVVTTEDEALAALRAAGRPLECVVNGIASAATALNDSALSCIIPAADAPMRAPLSLESAGVVLSDQSSAAGEMEMVAFDYFATPLVRSLRPSFGPSQGGTTVYVTGEGFGGATDGDAVCRFGGATVVPATVVRPTLLRCQVPAREASAELAVAVEVGFNGVDFSNDGVRFSYKLDALVRAVTPSLGPASGGTAVTITGDGFDAHDDLFCTFGDAEPVVVEQASSSALLCTAPAHSAGEVELRISSSEGAAASSAAIAEFEYYAPPSVGELSPTHGPDSGGTLVLVRGTGFVVDSPSAMCRFGGDAVVSAVSVPDSTTVVCQAPSHKAGEVAVEVTMNNVDFTSDGVRFVYGSAPVVYSISPYSGPTGGGTVIRVHGENFADGTALACRFGTAGAAPAVFESDGVISCVAPEASIASKVTVEVTTNGVDYTTDGVQFLFVAPMSVASISPATGPEHGGTTITLAGSDFAVPEALVCEFGSSDLRVAAHWISPAAVTCVAPANQPSTVEVRLSTNGQQFVTAPTPYTFHATAAVLALAPTSGSINGGTLVVVNGVGFVDSSLLRCRFGGAAPVEAVFVSSTSLRCRAPAQTASGSVAVAVAINGVDFTDATAVYEYRSAIRVTSVTPRNGPVGGGTRMVVTGSGFEMSGEMLCQVGDALPSPAEVLNASALVCVSPSHDNGAVAVEVSANGGVDFTTSGVQYAYLPPIKLSHMHPNSGPASGGTSVLVSGEGFSRSADLTCTFGPGVLVKAHWVHPTAVRCEAPPASPSAVTVKVSNNMHDYPDDGLTFGYVGEVTVSKVFPTRGPDSGGTLVLVRGTGFVVDSPSAMCRFGGDAVVSAVSVPDSTTVVCQAPSHKAGEVAVEVTMNNVDFTSDGVRFVYGSAPVVYSISPYSGPTGGGTVIRVHGENFADGTALACRFGAAGAAPAVFESDGVISCVAPEASIASKVTVEVTTNGVDYTTDGVQFLFVAPMSVASISPATGPEHGGTTITLAGSDFAVPEALVCEFGSSDLRVAAHWISPAAVTCVAPANQPSTVEVRLSTNGQQFVTAPTPYTFHATAAVLALAPTSGSINGGTLVVVNGVGFVDSSLLRCRFGGAAPVEAVFVSSTSLRCRAPAQTASGSVAVAVAINGVDFTDATAVYEYRSAIRVTSVTPRNGPVGGGTRMVVTGSGFEMSGETLCQVGDALPSPAEVLNASALVCVSPSHGNGAVAVEVSANGGVDFTTSGVLFTFDLPIAIESVFPALASALGGVVVTINGANFVRSELLKCRFGETAPVSGTWLSREALTCVAPAHSPGRVTVEVSNNDVDFSSDFDVAHVEFHAEIALLSATPELGPVVGGTLVTVFGNSFPVATSALLCSFGGVHVSATVVSASELQCVSPPSERPEPVALDVTYYPTAATPTVGSALKFAYVEGLVLSSIAPASGPMTGGTVLDVRGGGIVNSSALWCGFFVEGEALTPLALPWARAVFLSASHVQCVVPAFAAVDESGGGGLVTVKLTDNGREFTTSGVRFAYDRPVVVRSISPALGSEDGGTLTTVRGSHFMPYATLSCQFGAAPPSKATWLNSDAVRCVAPPNHADERVNVSVTNNLRDFSTSPQGAVGFAYHKTVFVADVTPRAGPLTGGTRVTVVGANFVSDADSAGGAAVCKFGDTAASVVSATVVYETLLECTAPAQPFGSARAVDVRVSLNNVDFSAAGGFVYFATPLITDVAPSSGALRGGTVVELTGANLAPVSAAHHVMCRFGADHTVLAERGGSSSTVLCAAPDLGLTAAAAVSVEVSTNSGVDFTSLGLAYTYDELPDVRAAHPATAVDVGGTPITLVGGGFLATPHLACRFGDVLVPARLSSADAITCRAPPHAPASVCLDVTQNGVDFTACALTFRFAPAVRLDAVAPASGPTGGVTPITISGANFASVNASAGAGLQLACSFAQLGVSTDATLVSDSTIECHAPPSDAVGAVNVSVTLAALPVTSDALVFSFLAALTVTAITPSHGPVTGGTQLAIEGRGFLADMPLGCVFTLGSGSSGNGATGGNGAATAAPLEVETVATFVSATSILCATPSFASSSLFGAAADGGASNETFAVVEVAFHTAHRTRQGRLFWLRPALDVTAVAPRTGDSAGGTALTLTGRGWTRGDSVSCRFGASDVVAARVLSRSQLVCDTPVASAIGRVSLELTTNGQDYTSNGVGFEYTPTVTVVAVAPLVVPASGGTRVNVSGTGFLARDRPTCRFATATVAAEVVSPQLIQCRAPALSLLAAPLDDDATATVAVAVSNNGAEFVEDAASQLTYVAAVPRVSRIEPSAVVVGNAVSVRVVGTQLARARYCRFGAHVVRAGVASRSDDDDESLTCDFGALACASAGKAAVELSLNGEDGDFTSDRVPLVCEHAPSVARVSPPLGPTSGGSAVTVVGAYFRDGPALSCRFGAHADATVAATWLNASALACVAPTAATPGDVVVAVSSNGVHFSSAADAGDEAGGRFRYHAPERLDQLEPSRVAAGFGAGEAHAAARTLTVRGANFADVPSLSCRIGDGVVVAATFMSATEVRCALPPLTAGLVRVAVANNGVDFGDADDAVDESSRSSLELVVEPVPSVSMISPRTAIVGGNVLLSVFGTGFIDRPGSLMCRFGDLNGTGGAADADARPLVPATYVSPTELRCETPAEVARAVGSFAVEVTNDGRAFSASGVVMRFHDAVFVSGVSPEAGPETGGTVVIVRGVGFSPAFTYECEFGASSNTRTPAAFYSTRSIACISPAHVVGPVTLAVRAGGTDVAARGGPRLAFLYYASPLIERISPANGPAAGGGTVTLSGNSLHPAMTMISLDSDDSDDDDNSDVDDPSATATWCRFGTSVVAALSSSAAAVVCPVPASPGFRPRASVSVELSMNGADYTSSGSEYTYDASETLSAIGPTSGPTEGGTKVSLTGLALAPAARHGLRCRFGASERAPTVYARAPTSARAPTCTTPPVAAPGVVALWLAFDDGAFVSTGLLFEFTRRPEVSAVQPDVVGEAGGQIVTVIGEAFVDSQLLACRFGWGADAVVEALWMSPTRLACRAPPLNPGRVAVAVTSNGQNFSPTSARAQLSVREQLTVTSVAPAVGPQLGGTLLTITGTGFVRPLDDSDSDEIDIGDVAAIGESATAIVCVFDGGLSSVATFVSETVVTCVSAPSPSLESVVQSSSLELVQAGGQLTAADADFTYHPELAINELSPAIGPSSGGTLVRVALREPTSAATRDVLELARAVGFWCHFGSSSSSERVLGVVRNGPRDPSSGARAPLLTCRAPPAASGQHEAISTVDVRLSLNGLESDVSLAAVPFAYYATPSIASVQPAALTEAGGEITIIGSAFPRLDDDLDLDADDEDSKSARAGVLGVRAARLLLVRIGDAPPVAASWKSNTTLVARAARQPPGLTVVRFSANGGADWTDDRVALEFVRTGTLTRLAPAVVSTRGGALVSLHGVNLARATAAMEVRLSAVNRSTWSSSATVFGAPTPIVLAATLVDEHTVTFAAPHLPAAEWGYSAAGGDGDGGSSTVETSVELLLHGAPVGPASLVLTHLPQLELLTLSPNIGSVRGGTQLSLSAVNLLPDVAHVCRFVGSASGDSDSAVVIVETPAAVVNGTLALCPTPTHPFGADDDDAENGTLGAMVVFLVRDDGDVSGGSSKFHFVRHMELVAALPSLIPNAGGVAIAVHGQAFARTEALACRFGAASGGGAAAARTVRAAWINASLIECEAPPATVGEGIVDLMVSMNRVDWVGALQIAYEGDRAVTAVTPGAGRLEGGTRVVLRGTGFSSFYANAAANSSSDAAPSSSSFSLASDNEAASVLRPYCRFGQVDVAASVRSDTELECENAGRARAGHRRAARPCCASRTRSGASTSRASRSRSSTSTRQPSSRSSQSRARRAGGTAVHALGHGLHRRRRPRHALRGLRRGSRRRRGGRRRVRQQQRCRCRRASDVRLGGRRDGARAAECDAHGHGWRLRVGPAQQQRPRLLVRRGAILLRRGDVRHVAAAGKRA